MNIDRALLERQNKTAHIVNGMWCFKYSTRFVILFKNIVVKIPICRKGLLQGYNEKKIWNKYKYKAPLAELKWMFLGIVCQKRYLSIDAIPHLEVEKIKKVITEFNFNNCDFGNYENWGKNDKEYILLDYGNCSYVASLYK
jgi:hypothetical protein